MRTPWFAPSEVLNRRLALAAAAALLNRRAGLLAGARRFGRGAGATGDFFQLRAAQFFPFTFSTHFYAVFVVFVWNRAANAFRRRSPSSFSCERFGN
jgi:hypothetical protein